MYGYGNSLYLTTRAILAKANSGTPPVNTVAPVISGTQVVGSTLSSTTGTWTGSPAPTYTYQWYRGAILISGATSSTYTLVQADAGNTSNINCQVTAINTYGSATATSNILAQILDFDANAFITSAAITDNTQKAATNKLTIDLKGYGIWTKMKALYPFVGGTASTHKFNLKDPRDLDAAFRLVFNGGWTHSSTGATPNGTNGYADTKLNDNSIMTLNNAHISIYSRTNSDGLFCDIGVTQNVPTTESNIFSKYLNVFYPRIQDSNIGIANSVSSLGMFVSNRVASNQIRAFQNNVLKTISITSTGIKVNRNFYLGAMSSAASNASLFSNRQLAFASIGDGLTDAEAANFYIAVQAFQTTLSRNV